MFFVSDFSFLVAKKEYTDAKMEIHNNGKSKIQIIITMVDNTNNTNKTRDDTIEMSIISKKSIMNRVYKVVEWVPVSR